MASQLIDHQQLSAVLREQSYRVLSHLKRLAPLKKPLIIVLVAAGFAFIVIAGVDANNQAYAGEIFRAIKSGNSTKACELINQHRWCLNYGDPIGDETIDRHGRTRGWTMLHYAAYRGQSDVARALILNGADVNVWVGGVSALDATVIRGYRRNPTADVLLAHKAKGVYFSAERAYSEARNSEGSRNMDFIINTLSAQLGDE